MYKIIGADGKEYGPATAEQLKQWVAEGRVNAQTKVLPEGGADWVTLETLPEFFSMPGDGAPSAGTIPAPIQTLLPAPRRTNPLALTGMILGLCSATFGLCCCYGFPFNIAGIVFSLVGMRQIRQNPHLYDGRGMAITGLVASILSFVLAGLMIVLGVALGWQDIMRDFGKR